MNRAPAKIRVPGVVFDGIEAVRRGGLTNMLDAPRVAELACAAGAFEAAEWIQSNPGLYSRAIFCGFEVIREMPSTTTVTEYGDGA